MQKYLSHKIVEAQDLAANGIELVPGDKIVRVRLNGEVLGDIPARLIGQLSAKETLDGYIVKYSDGYISWSPRTPFEEGYIAIGNGMFRAHYTGGISFGEALRYLKGGISVARAGWNGKGMSLELQVPDTNSKMTLAYIFMNTADGQKVPWLASQSDMLAEDWGIISAAR